MGVSRALSTSVVAIRVLALLLLAGSSLFAQEPVPVAADVGGDPPAHISLVEGAVMLEREGQVDNSPLNMPLLAGDRLRTRSGRVEVLFADGSTLHLDNNSVVDLQSDDLIRLIDGRARLSIPGATREVRYRIDGPHGWLTITEPGDYRLALMNGPRGSEIEAVVFRGRAYLANEGGSTELRAGERAFARANAAPSEAYVANSAAWDAFDRWSEARRDERLRATSTYLPEEVRPYAATLEQYGSWGSEPTYGAVWYPRVQPDWRPYYYGRWVTLNPYGWTWVAHDPWGWPTHHYGRWGYASGAWFWIPGRTWGAAWVSWAYAPSYVSWCPLGWNNRPVFGFSINVNIGHSHNPWHGWTVLPRQHFGVGYVNTHVVRGDALAYGVRSGFVARDRAPDWGTRAVPRVSAPIRVAGTRGGNRGTPIYTNVPADRARVGGSGQRVAVPGAANSPATDAPRGARPNYRAAPPSTADGARAVSRDRMTPDRPAVRSQRADSPAGRVDAPSAPTSPYNVPVYRGGVRTEEPVGGARPSGARPSVTRDEPSAYRPAPSADGGRAVPRYGAPRTTRTDPSAPTSDGPASNGAPVYGRAPRTDYGQPAAGESRRPPEGYRGPGAEPRAPRAVERAPQSNDGPSRPGPGSYRSSPSSPPPAPRAESPRGGGSGGSAGPPAGARPRGGGRGGR